MKKALKVVDTSIGAIFSLSAGLTTSTIGGLLTYMIAESFSPQYRTAIKLIGCLGSGGLGFCVTETTMYIWKGGLYKDIKIK